MLKSIYIVTQVAPILSIYTITQKGAITQAHMRAHAEKRSFHTTSHDFERLWCHSFAVQSEKCAQSWLSGNLQVDFLWACGWDECSDLLLYVLLLMCSNKCRFGSRALFPGFVSGPCFRALFPGFVSGPCFRALFPGFVSGLCFRALFPGFVTFRDLFSDSDSHKNEKYTVDYYDVCARMQTCMRMCIMCVCVTMAMHVCALSVGLGVCV